jgi:hypothetical protein
VNRAGRRASFLAPSPEPSFGSLLPTVEQQRRRRSTIHLTSTSTQLQAMHEMGQYRAACVIQRCYRSYRVRIGPYAPHFSGE